MATITDRKMDLLIAAGALFSKWGYHGTTVRELAKALDVQGGSIYAHIASKEDLLWDIVDIVAAKFHQMAAEIPAGLGPKARMEALVRGHLATVASELHFATVFFNEWTCLGDRRRSRIAERRDEYEAVFRRTIDQGVKQGVFRVANPKLAAIYVLSVLNWSHQWFRPTAGLRIDEVADQFVDLTLRALGTGGRS
jgi:AcrR family transcriptional regulator